MLKMKVTYRKVEEIEDFSRLIFVEDDKTYITSNQFMLETLTKYNNREFFCRPNIDGQTEFENLWNNFIDINKHNLIRVYETLTRDYNPVENVDERIERVYGERTTTLETGDQTNTSTIGSQTMTSNKGGTENTSSTFENSMESTEYLASGKSVDALGESINESSARTDTNIIGNRLDTSVADTYTDTEYRHGNIGVTYVADGVVKELDLRINNFVSYTLSLFYKQYTFDRGGDVNAN